MRQFNYWFQNITQAKAKNTCMKKKGGQYFDKSKSQKSKILIKKK